MQKAGIWFFTSKICEKQPWKSGILGKDAGHHYS